MLRRFISASAAVLAADSSPARHSRAERSTRHCYDPVAYHTVGMPVEASKRIIYRWRDATWRFASVKHRDQFAADPERYTPAYGSYCAYGMAQGAKVDIDPSVWRIVDGKLYLNVNKRVQQIWKTDISGYIARANRHWQGLMG